MGFLTLDGWLLFRIIVVMLRGLLLLLVCIGVKLNAQIDTLIGLSPEEQAIAVRNIYHWLYEADRNSAPEKLQQLERESVRRKEIYLAQEFWSIRKMHQLNSYHDGDAHRLQIAQDALLEARDKEWDIAEAQWMITLGAVLFEQGQLGAGFENLLKGWTKLREIGFDRYPHLVISLVGVSLTHYRYGDYETAVTLLKEVVSKKDAVKDDWGMTNAMNTLALSYQHLAKYDSALHYFQMTYDFAKANKDSAYMAIVSGNKAMILLKMGRKEEAKSLLEFDFENSRRKGVTGSAVNAGLELASIHIEHGELAKAQYYQDYAGKYVDRQDQIAMQIYYKNMYEIYRARGDYQRALLFQDSAKIMSDSVQKSRDVKILTQARHKLEVEKYSSQLRLLEASREKEVLIRNGTIVIIVLTGASLYFWFHRRYTQRQKALQVSELKNQLAEEELISAQKELQSFTKMLTEKNALLESFQEEVDKIRTEENQETRNIDLSKLLSRSILTEEDWREFRALYEKVYPGFFYRLNEKLPDLTQTDIRLLALTKLHVSTKDMAAMLGVSYEAIKKSRQRLRHRFQLPEEGNLDEVVALI